MKAGFTGTREGMTKTQHEQLERVLEWLAPDEFHHGASPDGGADVEAAELVSARNALYPNTRAKLVQHLPKRREAKDLLARNREIVAAVDVLIAAPDTDAERQRSGTWATVRYAREKGIPVVQLSRGRNGNGRLPI